MKARVLQAALSQPFGRRRVTGAAERARRTKSAIVNEQDQDVWRTSWRTQLPDRRKLGIRILRAVGGQRYRLAVGDRQYVALDVIAWARVRHQRSPWLFIKVRRAVGAVESCDVGRPH